MWIRFRCTGKGKGRSGMKPVHLEVNGQSYVYGTAWRAWKQGRSELRKTVAFCARHARSLGQRVYVGKEEWSHCGQQLGIPVFWRDECDWKTVIDATNERRGNETDA